MPLVASQLATWLDLFGRAGGGGSSSGGGGDGGSIIVLVGYLPMHFITAKLRKRGYNGEVWPLWQAVGWLVCLVYGGLLILLLDFIGFFMAIGAVMGTGAGLYNWFSKLKRKKKVTQALQAASQKDAAWNEADVVARTREVFMAYQRDWTARNTQAMAGYMTARYHQHASLMMAALHQAKRINEVHTPVIEEAMVVNLYDADQNDQDVVTVGLTAKANDRLIDEPTGKVLFRTGSAFTEFWRFRRSQDTWLLDGIEQATRAGWVHNASLEAFAGQHSYFYSPDWGWLLIPKRGQLFGKAKFGVSDINNHIIGLYKERFLLQLYTYDPNPKNAGAYLIAQTNIPKVYGNIVVRRKKWYRWGGPRGLKRVTLEWSDFHKKYDVFASDAEQVASFELLHPLFMEKLEAMPFDVNLEVVDNVIYLYAPQSQDQAADQRYPQMLALLEEAYKQMKL